MTVQNLYTQYLDGKITKQKFLYEVRRDQNLDMISSSNSFDDVVKILKNKSIISEKAHKEAKESEGKQEVDIIAKTIDMVNPYEYTRGMEFELGIMDVPATNGDLSEDNILKAQKKVLANLTKNPQFYFEKINGKGEVEEKWIEATKKEIDKIGKGKASKIIRENLGHNEISSIHPEGPYWVVTFRGPKGTTEKIFKSEEEARKFQDSLSDDQQKINWTKVVQALSQVGSKDEIKQYLTSLHQSGDTFDNVDDFVEDFKNYIADKSLEEHGQYADRVADVNADSSPLKEKQEAIYKKYAESTGIPMENLMAMVREAKAKKLQEADDTPEEKKAKDLEVAAEKAKIAASNKKIQDLNQGR